MNILCIGGDLSNMVFVDFWMEDGIVKVGEDYEKMEGIICFRLGEFFKIFFVVIVDDDIFEEDEYFYVYLGNVCVVGVDGDLVCNIYRGLVGKVGKDGVVIVIIFDDDYFGIFIFEEEKYFVVEVDGMIKFKVICYMGVWGIVCVFYYIVEGIVKGGGEDYEDVVGELEFMNDEIWWGFVFLLLF